MSIEELVSKFHEKSRQWACMIVAENEVFLKDQEEERIEKQVMSVLVGSTLKKSNKESERFEPCCHPIPLDVSFSTEGDHSVTQTLSMEWDKLKQSLEEPPELELENLPKHLEYAFLESNNKLPVIIATNLYLTQKEKVLQVLKDHKWAIASRIFAIQGISQSFCTHVILMQDEIKP